MKLRPYQQEAAQAVLAAFQAGVQRALYVLPTGTGKTVTAARIIQARRQDDDRPALVLAHREELLAQAAATIGAVLQGARIETERAEERASARAQVILASLPTLARAGSTRLDWLAKEGASLIWYDEAHHAAADGAGRALSRLGVFEGRSPLVGCTATPHRLDNRPLEGSEGKATFEQTVYRYELLQAIRDGWLCNLRGFVIRSDVSLTGVETRAGDFAEGQLNQRIDVSARTEQAARRWKDLAGERPTLVFCASIEHAEHAAEHFRAVGARSEALHGGMDRRERAALLARFRSGEVQVLTNCQIATEGFDHPPLSCIVMLRPTKSWSLYAQMVGRGTRLYEGKEDCLILDVVDNCDHHSLVTCPRLADLPAGVDLVGQSLLEAREEMDALGVQAASLPDEPGAWKDLVARAIEVPLFALPDTPPEVAQASRLRWLPGAAGSLYLPCGAGRRARLLESPVGYSLLLEERPASGQMPGVPWATAGAWTAQTLPLWGSLPRAVRQADAHIRERWPDAGAVAGAGNTWRGQGASDKQLALILRLTRKRPLAGLDLQTLTRGQASDLIAHLTSAKEMVTQ